MKLLLNMNVLPQLVPRLMAAGHSCRPRIHFEDDLAAPYGARNPSRFADPACRRDQGGVNGLTRGNRDVHAIQADDQELMRNRRLDRVIALGGKLIERAQECYGPVVGSPIGGGWALVGGSAAIDCHLWKDKIRRVCPSIKDGSAPTDGLLSEATLPRHIEARLGGSLALPFGKTED